MAKLLNYLAIGLLPSAALLAENHGELNIYSVTSLGSTSGEAENFGFHGHDPNDDFTLQGLELNARYFLGDYISTSITYNLVLDDEDEFEAESEDIYARFHLFDNTLRLTAGQIFHNTSSENTRHVHGWNFANGSLLTSRFNGDEGLLARGAAIEWTLPVAHTSYLSLNVGNAVEDEHGEEEGHLPNEVEGEEALLAENIFTLSLRGIFLKNDFNQFHYNAHYSTGDNHFGLDAASYGAGVEYVWRENGQESGGKHFAVGAEFIQRSYDFESEDGTVTGSEDELGFAVSTRYKFAETWEAGVRYEHVEGSEQVEEVPEVDRFSAVLTKTFDINEHFDSSLRLQYDNLDRGDAGREDAVWLQWKVHFGHQF